MKTKLLIFIFVVAACSSANLFAQDWSGILLPTSGSGACAVDTTSAPEKCAIDWSTAGVPGGIPSRTTICSTLAAGSSVSSINSALSSCPSGEVVLLSAGTYTVNGTITVPGNVTLRGAGANQTILNLTMTSGPAISLGSNGASPSYSGSVAISAGNTAGSTSITVSSAAGITAGEYLLIDSQNDGTIVTSVGDEGNCSWCDAGQSSGGTYARGQIVEVEGVSGNNITISPGLYVNYTTGPVATPFAASAKYAGVENLQVVANDTHTSGNYSNFAMSECAYCWISGVEGNYTDGDHVDVFWGYHDQIQNSYFSNSYIHTAGTYDSNIDLMNKTSGSLVQNNILERLHTSIMMEWGAAGNVSAYNYMFGNFDQNQAYFTSVGHSMHGANPQFNLMEGNIDIAMGADSVWGSSTNNTMFRNFFVSTGLDCTPTTPSGTVVPRGTVNCSPIGVEGAAGVNGWWTPEGAVSEYIDARSTGYNSVGNVLGSTSFEALYPYDNPTAGTFTFSPMINSICGPSPCGSGVRNLFFGLGVNYSIGFNGTTDSGNTATSTGTANYDTIYPYNTFFIHGDFTSTNKAVNWASGVTQSLPASFYLPGKPAWFGSVAWPAIGPDVTSGSRSDSYGYANKIPAQVCYESVMGGTNGAGSPLSFNADTCYSSAVPLPPSNVVATPH